MENVGVNRQFQWPVRKWNEQQQSVCVLVVLQLAFQHSHLSGVLIKEWYRPDIAPRTRSFSVFSMNFQTLLIYPKISPHGGKTKWLSTCNLLFKSMCMNSIARWWVSNHCKLLAQQQPNPNCFSLLDAQTCFCLQNGCKRLCDSGRRFLYRLLCILRDLQDWYTILHDGLQPYHKRMYRVCQKKCNVKRRFLFFLNRKITKFEINMNIIMWGNLLCVSGFFPVNLGASVNKLFQIYQGMSKTPLAFRHKNVYSWLWFSN